MEQRLTAISLSATTNLSDRMIDNIDTKINALQYLLSRDASDIYSSNEFEKLNQLKKDIIHQSIEVGRQMLEPFAHTIEDEQKKFFVNKYSTEQSNETEIAMVDAIQTRRLHMIQRANYITEQKIFTSFKPIISVDENMQK